MGRGKGRHYSWDDGGGSISRSQTAEMAWEEAKPIWDQASADFAEGARGTAHVFQAASVRLASSWAKAEYPKLIGNGVKIIYHDVFG